MRDIDPTSTEPSYQPPYTSSESTKEDKKTEKLAAKGGVPTSESTKEAVRQAQEAVRLTQEKVSEQSAALVVKMVFGGNGDAAASLDILNELMATLSSMARTLQKIAKLQAESLTLPTKMQALYTKLMGEVKIWTIKDFTGDEKEEQKISKCSIANNKSGIITDRFRSCRDMMGDTAKAIQSTISTSDDAQKAMLEFLQTFLQKLRECASTLFR